MNKILRAALTLLFSFAYIIISTYALAHAPVRSFAVHAQTPAVQTSAPAAGDYACLQTSTAFFYSAPSADSGLFLLPKSYYVKLLSYGAEYCKIEYQTDTDGYQKLIGYAETGALTFVSYTPKRPYFSYVFELRYHLGDALQPTSDFLTEITFDCAYYGDYTVGSNTYCYVLRNGEFGYVPKPSSIIIDENTEYTDYLASLTPPAETPTPTPTTPADDTASSPIQIGILIALCLLVPLLAALILKPPRRPPYENNDF